MDLVNQKTVLVLYEAHKNLPPPNLQTMFREREGGYALRGKLNWKQPTCNRVMKSRCISVSGVKLWKALPDELKHSRSVLKIEH